MEIFEKPFRNNNISVRHFQGLHGDTELNSVTFMI